MLGFGALGIAPPVGLALGVLGFGVGKWFDYLNDSILREIERELDGRGCKPERRRPDGRPTWIFDPSGYVYEGLEGERLEGVTATIVHADDPAGPFDVWDAEWFGQRNPQLTNPEGRYGWDVPEGYWQVLWEAEGYEPASSAVLRVLPPHLDVNAGLRRLAPPEVAEASATGGAASEVLVTFDGFMDVESVLGRIRLLDDEGEPLAGEVTAVDAAANPTGLMLARTFRHVPAGAIAVGGAVNLHVDATVRSYTGAMMREDATQALVAAEPPPGEEPEPADPWEQAALNKLVAELRLLGARYRDVEAALEDGFEPVGDCLPRRGLHYARDIPDGAGGLDPRDPNVLVYAPTPSGHLRLVAVAFGAREAAGATLLGMPLVPPDVSGLEFWSLHVWVGQGNPDGVLAPEHPNVRCPEPKQRPGPPRGRQT